MNTQIYIGADHAGFALKEYLKKELTRAGCALIDVGAKTFTPTDDYPDFAKKAVANVARKKTTGILICGSGIGMSIAANRVKGVRAALCDSVQLAKLARRHDHANILCLGARVVSKKQALAIAKTFLREPFEGGRHARRVKKVG